MTAQPSPDSERSGVLACCGMASDYHAPDCDTDGRARFGLATRVPLTPMRGRFVRVPGAVLFELGGGA